jgi:hypothetical protein
MPDDFWQNLINGHAETVVPGAVDQRIAGHAMGEDFESMRSLTDRYREANALELPVPSGTRVSFTGSLGAYLSEENLPPQGVEGEVVSVRSATYGDVTSHEGKVFVKWDDGEFRSIHATYLRKVDKPVEKKANIRYGDPSHVATGRIPRGVNRFRVASLGDITSFLKVAEGTLIHKSTNDLWSFSKDADGGLVVERLFDDNGEPLQG